MSTLAGCRSPWSHSDCPAQRGAATASSQIARMTCGSGGRLLLGRRDCSARVGHRLEHELLRGPFHGVRQGSASHAVFWCLGGGRPVHGGQERGQRIGSRNTARDRRNVGGHFRNPRGDDPRVGVSLRWLTEP